MFSNLLNPLAILVSISTATGVFMHDMSLDKLTSTALALPSVMANYEANGHVVHFGGDLHPHVERLSLSQAVNDLKGQNPRIQPRLSDDKKHLLQKRVMRGHHPFDNYNLPIV